MEKDLFRLILLILVVDLVGYYVNLYIFVVALSKKFPKNNSFGMEIRDKLVNYVGEKINALRFNEPGNYQNISVVRTNA